MSTPRERLDRQAQVAQLTAAGCSVGEVAKILRVTRPTVYRDLQMIRARSRDRILMDEDDEAAAIDLELRQLDNLYAAARRVLEERTEPGTREYAAMLASLVRLKNLKLHAAAELGVYRKAVQRHLLLDGDELANLEGDELEEYCRTLDEAENRLARAMGKNRQRRRERGA